MFLFQTCVLYIEKCLIHKDYSGKPYTSLAVELKVKLRFQIKL